AGRSNFLSPESLMKLMKQGALFMSIVAALSLFAAKAQTPVPIIVHAAAPASASHATAQQPGTPATNASSAILDSASLQAALKSLQEIKAANEEPLRQQEAAIQQLDELQKSAEQMKIFSKRG